MKTWMAEGRQMTLPTKTWMAEGRQMTSQKAQHPKKQAPKAPIPGNERDDWQP